MVSKDSIYQELEQILASDLFGGKKQAGNFLRYIVTEALEGRGERITQYGIAIEALGKPVDYCPTESPAVRVEAGRVRKLLEEYYSGEGAESGCYIFLPVGGYQPEFRKPDMSRLQLKRLTEKRVRSSGPKIYFACQNPSLIRNNTHRELMFAFRSNLPVILGRLNTVQVALADPEHLGIHTGNALEYAWLQHQAEFLLQCEFVVRNNELRMHCALIHTLSRELVWKDDCHVDEHADSPLDEVYSRLVSRVFSYDRGVAMLYWSRYWYRQDHIPDYYQVLVRHILLVQDRICEDRFFEFWRACQKRCCQYDDDTLAQLHYAIACLYARMLQIDVGISLDELWHRQALAALEMNAGSPLAHAIFALSCYARGDAELCEVEIVTAHRLCSHDAGFGRLLGIGLCSMGAWEKGVVWLKRYHMAEISHPDPLQSLPCLHYFRKGDYISLAADAVAFKGMGGWEQFGNLVGHCRAGDCKTCIHALGKLVDRAMLPEPETVYPNDFLWADHSGEQALPIVSDSRDK